MVAEDSYAVRDGVQPCGNHDYRHYLNSRLEGAEAAELMKPTFSIHWTEAQEEVPTVAYPM